MNNYTNPHGLPSSDGYVVGGWVRRTGGGSGGEGYRLGDVRQIMDMEEDRVLFGDDHFWFRDNCIPCSAPDATQPAETDDAALTELVEAADRDIRLFDGQWVNVVNAPEVLNAETAEEAVHIAVRLTEQAMARNFAANKWPRQRAALSPEGAK